jgi:hypothetical protein
LCRWECRKVLQSFSCLNCQWKRQWRSQRMMHVVAQFNALSISVKRNSHKLNSFKDAQVNE